MAEASKGRIADEIRAAVACFRDAERGARDVYVVLEQIPRASRLDDDKVPRSERRPPWRIAVRRLYCGSHKGLESGHTIAVGLDLNEPTPAPIAVPVHSMSVEISIRKGTAEEAKVPFEGIFDIRALALTD